MATELAEDGWRVNETASRLGSVLILIFILLLNLFGLFKDEPGRGD